MRSAPCCVRQTHLTGRLPPFLCPLVPSPVRRPGNGSNDTGRYYTPRLQRELSGQEGSIDLQSANQPFASPSVGRAAAVQQEDALGEASDQDDGEFFDYPLPPILPEVPSFPVFAGTPGSSSRAQVFDHHTPPRLEGALPTVEETEWGARNVFAPDHRAPRGKTYKYDNATQSVRAWR